MITKNELQKQNHKITVILEKKGLPKKARKESNMHHHGKSNTQKSTKRRKKISWNKSYCLLVVFYPLPFQAKQRPRVWRAVHNENRLRLATELLKIIQGKCYLFDIVACLGTCFNKHNIKLSCFPLPFLSWNLWYNFIRAIKSGYKLHNMPVVCLRDLFCFLPT